jgi:hypothetical protein
MHDEAPSRLTEIMDTIAKEVGISNRFLPGSIVLNKHEALTVLSYIRTAKQLVERTSDDGK